MRRQEDSSIKRIASEGSLPVQIITRQDLERQGIVTAEQLTSSLSLTGNGLDNLASNAVVDGVFETGIVPLVRRVTRPGARATLA